MARMFISFLLVAVFDMLKYYVFLFGFFVWYAE